MANIKDNSKKQEQTSEYSQQDRTEASQKPERKKAKLKFKKEDMYSIKYDF